MDEILENVLEDTSAGVDYSQLLQSIIDNQQTIIQYLELIKNVLSGGYAVLLVALGLSAGLIGLLIIYYFIKQF